MEERTEELRFWDKVSRRVGLRGLAWHRFLTSLVSQFPRLESDNTGCGKSRLAVVSRETEFILVLLIN